MPVAMRHHRHCFAFIANVLGYDVFDPSEVIPEFTADVGVKRGEKVDYAICDGGNR